MDNTVRFVLGVLGAISAVFLYLAPITTFMRIHKNKSTQGFSEYPYVLILTLLKSLTSLWYSLPFVSSNNILVTGINGVGIVTSTVYTALFFYWAPNKKVRVRLGLLLGFVICGVILTSLVSKFCFPDNTAKIHPRKTFSGIVSCVSSIIMYGSPLFAAWKTKNVEFMTSLACFLCGGCGLVYGLLGSDTFISVSNGIGCGLGVLQLVIYFFYQGGNNSANGDESSIIP